MHNHHFDVDQQGKRSLGVRPRLYEVAAIASCFQAVLCDVTPVTNCSLVHSGCILAIQGPWSDFLETHSTDINT